MTTDFDPEALRRPTPAEQREHQDSPAAPRTDALTTEELTTAACARLDELRAERTAGELPIGADEVATRTDANRIDLADNVPAIELKPTYDGYLDVVMHGDAHGTQAFVDGQATDFTLEQTAQLIETSPSWEQRPIRLLSCSTGEADYAQELADRLNVPVYAPSDVLGVLPDGRTVIEDDGRWRRFEPKVP